MHLVYPLFFSFVLEPRVLHAPDDAVDSVRHCSYHINPLQLPFCTTFLIFVQLVKIFFYDFFSLKPLFSQTNFDLFILLLLLVFHKTLCFALTRTCSSKVKCSRFPCKAFFLFVHYNIVMSLGTFSRFSHSFCLDSRTFKGFPCLHYVHIHKLFDRSLKQCWYINYSALSIFYHLFVCFVVVSCCRCYCCHSGDCCCCCCGCCLYCCTIPPMPPHIVTTTTTTKKAAERAYKEHPRLRGLRGGCEHRCKASN